METVDTPNDQPMSVSDSSGLCSRCGGRLTPVVGSKPHCGACEDRELDQVRPPTAEHLAHEDRARAMEQHIAQQLLPAPLNDAEQASMFATLDGDTPGAAAWSTSYDGARRILATIQHLQGLVYVPGLWRCAKCKCAVIQSVMCATTGRIAADNKPVVCPNHCGPMWRVTERQSGNEVIDRFAMTERQQAEVLVARSWLKQPPVNPIEDLAVAVHHLKLMIAVAQR